MEVSFLFWNIRGKDNAFINTLKEFTHGIDILLLAESNIDDTTIEMNTTLKKVMPKGISDEDALTPRFYSKYDKSELQHLSTMSDKKRCVFLKFRPKGNSKDILIGGIHMKSKFRINDKTHFKYSVKYADWIRKIEDQQKNYRTLIFGDFNMNPFDAGMISSLAFNAAISKKIVGRTGFRDMHKNERYFYNPMWNWLGDISHTDGREKIPGSYRYGGTSDEEMIHWNVIDGLIFRKDLYFTCSISFHQIIKVQYTEKRR